MISRCRRCCSGFSLLRLCGTQAQHSSETTTHRLTVLRAYTKTFGANLLKAYTSWQALPPADRADARPRRNLDLSQSDKELFLGMPLGDLWVESRIHEVFLYLYQSKHCATFVCIKSLLPTQSIVIFPSMSCLRVPESWEPVMMAFKDEVLQNATRLFYRVFHLIASGFSVSAIVYLSSGFGGWLRPGFRAPELIGSRGLRLRFQVVLGFDDIGVYIL